MTERVVLGIRAVRFVAERVDPTAPMKTGEIASALRLSLSSSSRLCTELVAVGLLERGRDYGSYRLGRRAIRLSGRAAAPSARAVRYALTVAAQVTGETACIAARSGDDVRVVGSVGSEWTLHASADVGELVDPASAVAVAAGGPGARSGHPGSDGSRPSADRLVQSVVGRTLEVASPVLNDAGEHVAAVSIRLPINRAARGVPRARRAVEVARRNIEPLLSAHSAPRLTPMSAETSTPADTSAVGSARVGDAAPSALEAAALLLEHLAEGADTVAGSARAVRLRPDRAQRILESCRFAGVVTADPGDPRQHLRWGVHAWHRAATAPVLVDGGRQLVADAARRSGTYGFITVLRGIRSFTIVEELGSTDGGLVMLPWRGRPHPVIGSDGGPTLVMEFSPSDLSPLLSRRHTPLELAELYDRMRQVERDGVLTIQGIAESGLVSTSAPIRDASGAVAGAACLTGTVGSTREQADNVEHAARELAASISALLQ
ncbi:hypothetical protein ACPEEZ_13710 [Frigoribacterium sp. 2-23]|uniref:hypothetical protein n=1 Tax=Frigoribacterium sp. 2-23 TaxID=3415006 RepID=UPI003C6F16A2